MATTLPVQNSCAILGRDPPGPARSRRSETPQIGKLTVKNDRWWFGVASAPSRRALSTVLLAGSRADDSAGFEMSVENALKVLGVSEGASFDDILRAKNSILAACKGDQEAIAQKRGKHWKNKLPDANAFTMGAIDQLVVSTAGHHKFHGDPYEIQVEVPWTPQRCDGCKTFGHTTNLCPQKPKSLNSPSFKHEWRVKDTKTQISTKWEVVKKKGRDSGQGSTPLINKEREMQSSVPSTSNAFDVLESCDMDELGNGDSSQELRNRGSPSPSDPSYGETSKEDNRRKLKAKLHDLKNARRKF